jgi:pimeloyl-ACP methyl ester carboxylesterase
MREDGMEARIRGPQGRLNLASEGGGDKASIMFAHADAGTLKHWDDVRKALSPDHATAAIDRRGHGKSDFPANGSFAPGDAAADIAAGADAAGFDRFILVGHSGGALVTLAFAHFKPERVKGLVLVDPPPDPAILPPGVIESTMQALQSDQYEVTLEQYYRSIAGNDPKVVETVLADARATPKATVIGTFAALAAFRPQDFIGRYKGPALSIIQPEYDVEGALHRIGGFDHAGIGGVGHWLHLGARDRFLEVLRTFVAGIRH